MPQFKKSINNFFKMESSSGILLFLSALAAFIVANSAAAGVYFSFFNEIVFGLSIKYWINDGLMAIFFFLVGLEIKRELVLGQLNSPTKASFPLVAALGGMIVPAVIYLFFNSSSLESRGWGIPMATDIAFAVGILALFGKRVPLALKVFLLAVAIVDDLGAILVIAFFYTNEIKGSGLALASAAFGVATLLRFSGVRSYLVYTMVGIVVWVGFLYSGIHATIAGVLLGILTPTQFPKKSATEEFYSPLNELVHAVHPWVSFGVMPIFAFANAGVDLRGVDLFEVSTNSISLGIIFGLFFGKPIGVLLFTYVMAKLKVVELPRGLNWGSIVGVGFLAGIGFTMSLFISGLALTNDLEIYSKTGIILGSIFSGAIGSLLLWFNLKKLA